MGNAESRTAAQKNSSSSDDATARASAENGPTRLSLPNASDADLPSASEGAPRRHSMSAPSTTRRSSRRTRNRHTDADLRGAPTANRNVEAGGIERGQQATEEQTGQVGYWYLIKNGYTELVNLIIRPPRANYDVEELGPSTFTFLGREYQRIDFTVDNDREQTLQCSHWLPVQKEINGMTEFPCLIYLHGNSSCRLEALSVLRTCLASGMSVVAFDCAGCGKSDGDYISLGYYEREDLKCVMDFLRAKTRVSTIGLWGRSMGAATALLHADRDPSIAGIVVDSAFTNLEQLVQEIVERGRREGFTIPSFLVKIVMKFIRSSVQKRAVFDIKQLAPIDHASISFVPALFVAANGDDFIAPHHSDQIFAQYAGDKNIVKVEGDHNSVRPQFLLDSAGIFLQSALQVDPRLLPEATLLGGSRSGRTPWSNGNTSASLTRLMMMDLEAALHAGPGATAHIPTDDWSCPTCTFHNVALRTHVRYCWKDFSYGEARATNRLICVIFFTV
jgi:pimeloyl-ACP methyl ester carboxylesterase